MKVQVLIRLKSGVLDVQGKAVEHGLKGIGVEDASSIRIGKLVEFNVKSTSFEDARQKADEICKKLLVNPIIETYEIKQAL